MSINAAGMDIGTMLLQSARDGNDGTITFNTVRDCYRDIAYDEEFEETLSAQGVHHVRIDDMLYVLGNEAFLQAGMAEFGARGEQGDMLKRPMRDGILNPDSPKMAMTILRELMRACLEKDVGSARPGEILYFSIPANPVDSSINNSFHSAMAKQYLNGLGYDARPIGEGLAVVYAENPKMHAPDGDIPFTGIGCSFGAGQSNFCLAERGLPLDEFSCARGGDWIDANVARMTGTPRTRVTRLKERSLDFNDLDQSDALSLAMDCYYQEMIRYVFGKLAERFDSSKGSIDHPIDIILSGGTASPPGLADKMRSMLSEMSLPFEVGDVRTAKDMLRSVAKGCYLRAKQAAKKAG